MCHQCLWLHLYFGLLRMVWQPVCRCGKMGARAVKPRCSANTHHGPSASQIERALQRQPAQECPSASETKRGAVKEMLTTKPEAPPSPAPRFTEVTRKRKARKKAAPKCKCLTPVEYAWDALLSTPIWACVAALALLLSPFLIATGAAAIVMAWRWAHWLVG